MNDSIQIFVSRRALIDYAAVLSALDMPGGFNVLGDADFLSGFIPAHCPPGAVGATIERLRISQTFNNVRAHAHGARDNSLDPAAGVHRSFPGHHHIGIEMALMADVI